MDLTEDWTKPDKNGSIDIPDHLFPIFNKVITQIRFHTISRISEGQAAVNIVRIAEEFFLKDQDNARQIDE